MSDKKLTILIIDDREDFLHTMVERVELKGFNALSATNGKDALELAKTHAVDLAVVDLQLPDTDGMELIGELKKVQPEIETVLLTAYGGDKLREATKAIQTGYFEKQDMSLFWRFLSNFSRPTSFLIVDDDEDFLDTVSERILLKGYEVHTAASGKEALQKIFDEDIDYAVVDMKLPDMDGLEVISGIKKKKPHIRTLLLTGYGSGKIKEATKALDADYFEKQDMGGFWSFVKGVSRRLENAMAAAGMAEGGWEEKKKDK